MYHQQVRNYDKENDHLKRPLTSRSRSPYQQSVRIQQPANQKLLYVGVPQFNQMANKFTSVPQKSEQLQATFYGDLHPLPQKYLSPQDGKYLFGQDLKSYPQTPNIIGKQMTRVNSYQKHLYQGDSINTPDKMDNNNHSNERSDSQLGLKTKQHHHIQQNYLHPTTLIKDITYQDSMKSSQQLKKIIGVKKSALVPSPNNNSSLLQVGNKQNSKYNLGPLKYNNNETNIVSHSPMQSKLQVQKQVIHSQNKSFTMELQTKSQLIKQRCKSPSNIPLEEQYKELHRVASQQRNLQIHNPVDIQRKRSIVDRNHSVIDGSLIDIQRNHFIVDRNLSNVDRNHSIFDRSIIEQNSSIIDRNEELNLTYTHTNRSGMNNQRTQSLITSNANQKLEESPKLHFQENSQPVVIGKLLFNEHFSYQSNKAELSSRRNLSFNQFLDSQKQVKQDLSGRKSSHLSTNQSKKKDSYVDPPKRTSIAPFTDSVKKDESEIQQMVETLKQNILRDLQEVSKRYTGGSGQENQASSFLKDSSLIKDPSYSQIKEHSSYLQKETFHQKETFLSNFQLEKKIDSNSYNRFSFSQNENKIIEGGFQNQNLSINQSMLRESLQKVSFQSNESTKPPLKKFLSPDQSKTCFSKEGAQLYQQLSNAVGKQFQNQINSQRSKEEHCDKFNSPEEEKKQNHKTNTPNFKNQSNIHIRSKPSLCPLQLSFNMSDNCDTNPISHKKDQISEEVNFSESPVQLRGNKIICTEQNLPIKRSNMISLQSIHSRGSLQSIHEHDERQRYDELLDSQVRSLLKEKQFLNENETPTEKCDDNLSVKIHQLVYDDEKESISSQQTPQCSQNPISLTINDLSSITTGIPLNNKQNIDSPSQVKNKDENLITIDESKMSFSLSQLMQAKSNVDYDNAETLEKRDMVNSFCSNQDENQIEEYSSIILKQHSLRTPDNRSFLMENKQMNITNDTSLVESKQHTVLQLSAQRQERLQTIMKNFEDYRSQSNYTSLVKFDQVVQNATPKMSKQPSISEQPNLGHISDFIIYSQQYRESMHQRLSLQKQSIETPSLQIRESFQSSQFNPGSQMSNTNTLEIQSSQPIIDSIFLNDTAKSLKNKDSEHNPGSKLITFSQNDSDCEQDYAIIESQNSQQSQQPVFRQDHVFSRRRVERNNCPSFREVLKERDRSEKRQDKIIKDSSDMKLQPNPNVCRRINFSTYNTIQEMNSSTLQGISSNTSYAPESHVLTPRAQYDSVGGEDSKVLSFLQYMGQRKN